MTQSVVVLLNMNSKKIGDKTEIIGYSTLNILRFVDKKPIGFSNIWTVIINKIIICFH